MDSEITPIGDAFGLWLFLSYAILLGLMPMIGLFVLGQGQAIIEKPRVLAAAVLLTITSTALLLYTSSDALIAVVYEADTTETIWGELVSFTAILIATFIVTAFFLVPIQTRLGNPELASFGQLVLCSAIALIAIFLHRNDTINLPSWITTTQWGFWDHFALFGAVTALTIIYTNTIFDPTSGLLAVTGLLFGTIAIFFRTRNVLVRRSESSPTPS